MKSQNGFHVRLGIVIFGAALGAFGFSLGFHRDIAAESLAADGKTPALMLTAALGLGLGVLGSCIAFAAVFVRRR